MSTATANQNFMVAPGKHTWLETIHKNNMAGRVVKPNSFYNDVLLGKDEAGRFKPIPDEIVKAKPLYAGTAFVIGAKGKPLGKRVETECCYNGTKKATIFEADADQARLVDTAILCDHAFAKDGTPLIPVFNARTGMPVKTHEEMLETPEVIIKFNGNVYTRRIQNRAGGVFERAGDEDTFSFIFESAALGLVVRDYGDDWLDDDRWGVGLVDAPSFAFGVAVESSVSAPLIIQREGELIVRGTPEQLDAAVRSLEQLKK